MKQINSLESEVRSYCRVFPVTFKKAINQYLYDENGKKYVDFLCGAGSINYGHNNPILKKQLMDYLNDNGIIHSLDLASVSKEEFIQTFQKYILAPRHLNYKFQFTGPTGTNAVEAALKLARKIKKRANIIAFTNGFHGVTLGAVAATGNSHHRDGSGVPLNNVSFMPYDGYMGKKINTIDYIRRMLEDNSSGLDLPAAMIVETVQGEGGINIASSTWLESLQELCREFEILLIVDDIQTGCGRTGTFFSFEHSQIEPDMVIMSKSLSGFGLPFSILLIKPELDIWKPGEHNGTFRGNNLAFVTAKTAIENFWKTQEFENRIMTKSAFLREKLSDITKKYLSSEIEIRGKGLMFGVDCILPEFASTIRKKCFENGLILETCGSTDQVVKFMPPLVISEDEINEGLEIFKKSVIQSIRQSDFHIQLEKEIVQK